VVVAHNITLDVIVLNLQLHRFDSKVDVNGKRLLDKINDIDSFCARKESGNSFNIHATTLHPPWFSPLLPL
jgi:hypothetical protein